MRGKNCREVELSHGFTASLDSLTFPAPTLSLHLVMCDSTCPTFSFSKAFFHYLKLKKTHYSIRNC